MSKLKTYDRPRTLQNEPMPWPIVLHDGCGDPGCDVLAPGKWVTYKGGSGFGVIIAINDEQLTILWSQEPKGDFSNIAFRKAMYIAFPMVRRVFPSLIANNIVSIQPMTAPVGSVFYMDYVYGGDNLEKRCNSGPWVSKMFWRTYRCLKTRIQSLSSSLASSWHSWRTPSMTSGSEASRLLNKWAPVAGTKNGSVQQAIVEEYLRQEKLKKTLMGP